MNNGFKRRARWQENSPTPQFLHHHIRQYIGPAQGLRGWRQPTRQNTHVCGRKRTNLHSIEEQGEMLAPGLRTLEIVIDAL